MQILLLKVVLKNSRGKLWEEKNNIEKK